MTAPGSSTPRWVVTAIMVLVTTATIAGSFVLKNRCTYQPWDGRQWSQLCANDLLIVYSNEQYQVQHPFPPPTVEYPPVIVFYVAAARELGASAGGFFAANAIGIFLAGVGCVIALRLLGAGRRLWLFALSPPLCFYALQNWDLLAICVALFALWAVSRSKYFAAGVLIGIGAATKLFPAFLLPGVLLMAWTPAWRRDIRRTLTGSLLGFGVPNLVLYALSSSAWRYFWTFQSERFPNPETSWFMVFRHLRGGPFVDGTWARNYPSVVNLASITLFGVIALWLLNREMQRPERRSIELAFALTLAFLLTAKVFSPQYMLWLVPYLVLLAVPWRAIALFFIVDIAVLLVTNHYFLSIAQGGNWNAWLNALEVTVWARYLVLAWLLAWTQRTDHRRAPSLDIPKYA
ncbi:MAG: glycosyltransferase 87 family protein [Actinomycetota bacterium]